MLIYLICHAVYVYILSFWFQIRHRLALYTACIIVSFWLKIYQVHPKSPSSGQQD